MKQRKGYERIIIRGEFRWGKDKITGNKRTGLTDEFLLFLISQYV